MKINENACTVNEVYGDDEKMTITIHGIGDFSNSEIRAIIETAFSMVDCSQLHHDGIVKFT